MSIKSSAIYICISFFVFVALLSPSKAEESFCSKNTRIEFHEIKNKTLQLCIDPKTKLRQGPFKVLKNLQIQMEGYYLDDQLHGYLNKYHNNQIVEKIPYQLGKIDGKMLRLSKKGSLISESHWKDNKPHGVFKNRNTISYFHNGIQYGWESKAERKRLYYGGIKSIYLGASYYNGKNGSSHGPTLGFDYQLYSYPGQYQLGFWSKINSLIDYAEEIKILPSLGFLASKDIANFRLGLLVGLSDLDNIGVKASYGVSIHPLHALHLPGKKEPSYYPRIQFMQKERISTATIDMEIYNFEI